MLEETLIEAVKKEDKKKVAELIQKGVDVNAKDDNGDSALILAIKNVNLTIIQLLLECDVDVNDPNDDRETPLMWAVWAWHDASIQMLVDAGADISYKNAEGKTALDYAKEEQNSSAIRILQTPPQKTNFKNSFSATYENLMTVPKNKKIFDKLLKLGSIATVFDSETIDTYDKLKSVYKQLNDYMKDQPIKKQIQSAFIKKQNQLSH